MTQEDVIEIIEDDGGKCCRSACSDFFRHILHPTDFSETAERAWHLEVVEALLEGVVVHG